MHSSMAPILACVELRAVYVCLLDTQLKGPPSQMTWPAMEQLLKRSRRTGVPNMHRRGLGVLWGLVEIGQRIQCVHCFDC